MTEPVDEPTKDVAKKIPKPLKKQVRQACGFGCVICGLPLYEYDHIEPFSRVKKHELDNLALLCPNHHAQKTRHCLLGSVVRKHRENPYNLNKDYTKSGLLGFFESFSDGVEALVGGNRFVYDFSSGPIFKIFHVNGDTILGFSKEGDEIFFHLKLFDKKNSLLLNIEKNEIIHSTKLFDVTYEGTSLKVKSAIKSTKDAMKPSTRGEVLLDLRFGFEEGRVTIEHASLYHNGNNFFANKDKLFINGGPRKRPLATLENCAFIGPCAINLG